MSEKNLPKFRLTRTFTLGEPGLDTDFIGELIRNRGFKCESVAVRTADETSKPKRRRRSKVRVPLTSERIREFKKARDTGKSYRRIGQIFGVSEGRAWQIVNRGV